MSAGRSGMPSATDAVEAACEQATQSRSCAALAALKAPKASCEPAPIAGSIAVGWNSGDVSRSAAQGILAVRLLFCVKA
eukprot:13470346-Alexandrium_andersonii.AAC.1